MELYKLSHGDHVRCSANSPCARYGIIRHGRHFLCTAIPIGIVVRSKQGDNSRFATWVVHPVEPARLRTTSLAQVNLLVPELFF